MSAATRLDYASRTTAPKWSNTRFACACVSGLILAHYAFGLLLHGMGFVPLARFGYSGTFADLWEYFLGSTMMCAALLALAVFALLDVMRSFQRTRFWMCTVLLASIAAFSIDIGLHRFQVRIDLSSREYWDEGGRCEVYFTWWWYNDRWVATHLRFRAKPLS